MCVYINVPSNIDTLVSIVTVYQYQFMSSLVLHFGMLLQTMQAQSLLNAYKLVTYVNGPGSNSQGHLWSFVGNVKALLKLNVEN